MAVMQAYFKMVKPWRELRLYLYEIYMSEEFDNLVGCVIDCCNSEYEK